MYNPTPCPLEVRKKLNYLEDKEVYALYSCDGTTEYGVVLGDFKEATKFLTDLLKQLSDLA